MSELEVLKLLYDVLTDGDEVVIGEATVMDYDSLIRRLEGRIIQIEDDEANK